MIKKILRKLLGTKAPTKLPPGCIAKERMKAFLPANPIILEAGAADGSDTLEMSSVFPDATIYALEPIPDIFRQMKNTVKGCRNVKTFQVGLSDKTGKARFNLSTDEQGEILSSSSLLTPKEHKTVHPHILFDSSIEIDTITIDGFCLENNISHIDLLWIDLQGYEFQVLKASPNILKTVRVIHTEVSLIEAYEHTVLYPELKEWLISEGFSVEIEELPFKDMGNVVFVRRSK
jgi:FkbM family methyltransferase